MAVINLHLYYQSETLCVAMAVIQPTNSKTCGRERHYYSVFPCPYLLFCLGCMALLLHTQDSCFWVGLPHSDYLQLVYWNVHMSHHHLSSFQRNHLVEVSITLVLNKHYYYYLVRRIHFDLLYLQVQLCFVPGESLAWMAHPDHPDSH